MTITPLDLPVTARVSVPGSKSYTNRALLMAAMAPGDVTLDRPLISDDTEAMIRCLQTLGIGIERLPDQIIVLGDLSAVADRAYDLDVSLSGITMRFILALACVIPGTQTIFGKAPLNQRPIGELVNGLRQAGAQIEYLGTEGFPPVRVSSSALRPGQIELDGSISSQYFSAVLMVAPLVGDMTVRAASVQASKPYIDMTIDTMASFGVQVTNHDYHTYHVPAGQNYSSTHYRVEGDVSSASYFFAIAALTGSIITVSNLNPQSKQADMKFLRLLADMGSEVNYGADEVTVAGNGVKAVTRDMADFPDQAMTAAVLAAFAPGRTTLSGVGSLRVKETERVVALEQELSKMGVATQSTPDTLTIHGGHPHGASIDTYGDHRIAMAFAVAGTKIPGISINNPEVVSKTFPGFWDVLSTVLKTRGQHGR